ncbi:MAG: reverse transcriptase/maturase family protein [Patescibacteria group bacterium]
MKFNRFYQDTITIQNLLRAWEAFLSGKKKKSDVVLFQAKLMDNIFELRHELMAKTYIHGGYHSFNISDPKPRNIHKASVRDRLLHHLLYQELHLYFERQFIYDSYSCRLTKGTHRAIRRFDYLTRKVSKNNTRTCWILKCDIRKFFANIAHDTLKAIFAKYIEDKDIIFLLNRVIDSFNTPGRIGVGLPLGNLTSQLFVNVYMNEFDQFVKHRLHVKYYIRYADDFVLLSENKEWLCQQIPKMSEFLGNKLKLALHPDKVFIKTLASGVDFLGWVHFPQHHVLRTATKTRMMRRIKNHSTDEILQSYLGLLTHGNAYRLQEKVINIYGLLKNN